MSRLMATRTLKTMAGRPFSERHGHAAVTRDGKKETSEYSSWLHMKQRCHNPKCKDYPWYGALGIYVCEAWRNDFGLFFRHIGPKPESGYSIDRIDPNLGYEPGNVRWATRQIQAINKRGIQRITMNGRTMLVVEWADTLKLKPQLIYLRLRRGITDPEQILSPPARTSYRLRFNTKDFAR